MKLLCIGDIHIKPSNTHLVEILLEQVIKAIQEHSIDITILLGDILDTFERIHTQALNAAYNLINSIRKHTKVYILVGNHDLINNQQFLTTQHWMNGLKDWESVKVIDKGFVNDEVMFVPYVPVGRFTEALDVIGQKYSVNWKHSRIIFAHQEFKGCKMGAITSAVGDQWELEWPLVISGHIHDRQKPQPNVLYIGASIQNSFGDQSNPILLVIDSITKNHSEVILEMPKKKTIYTDISQINSLNIQQIVEKNTVDMLRIVVKCNYEEFKVYSKSSEYEKICITNPKCKIVHKPTETTDQVETTTQVDGSFDNILFQNVLSTRNENIYCMYMDIVHSTAIDPSEILIV